MGKDDRIGVRLDGALHALLRERAEASRRSLGDIVRLACEEYIQREDQGTSRLVQHLAGDAPDVLGALLVLLELLRQDPGALRQLEELVDRARGNAAPVPSGPRRTPRRRSPNRP